MIREIIYNIRFPFGSTFDKDPSIVFLKKIYNEILYCTCLSDKKCCSCLKKEKCIYYLLSGENFQYYPSICVKRDFVNKKTFSKNDVFQLKFYLIGVANNYYEFITSYFDSTEYIASFFFQKILIENKIINNTDIYKGTILYNNIIVNQNDIISSINYYNNKYKCHFSIPIFSNEEELININVENYPKVLIDYGVGKYAFIGGGKGSCESE